MPKNNSDRTGYERKRERKKSAMKCVIHLLRWMFIEIAFTRERGRSTPLLIYLWISVLRSQFTHQASKLAADRFFSCHTEFAHNSGFYLLWTTYRQPFTRNATQLSPLERGSSRSKKSMAFAHTNIPYMRVVCSITYVLILSDYSLMCAHLGAFYCSALHTIKSCVWVCALPCYTITNVLAQ